MLTLALKAVGSHTGIAETEACPFCTYSPDRQCTTQMRGEEHMQGNVQHSHAVNSTCRAINVQCMHSHQLALLCVQGANKPVRSIDGVKQHMEPHFDLIEQEDIPYLIRQHSRKYDWGMSCTTVWRRCRVRQDVISVHKTARLVW